METIKIEDIQILENPLTKALELERKRILKRKEEKEEVNRSRKSGLVGVAANDGVGKSGVDASAANEVEDADEAPISIGKYMKKESNKDKSKKRGLESVSNDDDGTGDEISAAIKSRLPPPPKKTTFGDFSGW
jgi:hypothetical protein